MKVFHFSTLRFKRRTVDFLQVRTLNPQTLCLRSRDLKHVSTVSSHLTSTGHDILFDDIKILAYGKTDTELLIKESLIIKQLNPRLNATVKSFPLEMF